MSCAATFAAVLPTRRPPDYGDRRAADVERDVNGSRLLFEKIVNEEGEAT